MRAAAATAAGCLSLAVASGPRGPRAVPSMARHRVPQSPPKTPTAPSSPPQPPQASQVLTIPPTAPSLCPQQIWGAGAVPPPAPAQAAPASGWGDRGIWGLLGCGLGVRGSREGRFWGVSEPGAKGGAARAGGAGSGVPHTAQHRASHSPAQLSPAPHSPPSSSQPLRAPPWIWGLQAGLGVLLGSVPAAELARRGEGGSLTVPQILGTGLSCAAVPGLGGGLSRGDTPGAPALFGGGNSEPGGGPVCSASALRQPRPSWLHSNLRKQEPAGSG